MITVRLWKAVDEPFFQPGNYPHIKKELAALAQQKSLSITGHESGPEISGSIPLIAKTISAIATLVGRWFAGKPDRSVEVKTPDGSITIRNYSPEEAGEILKAIAKTMKPSSRA